MSEPRRHRCGKATRVLLAGVGVIGLALVVAIDPILTAVGRGVLGGMLQEGWTVSDFRVDVGFRGIRVRDFAFIAPDGHPEVGADDVMVRLAPFSVFSGTVEVHEVRLGGGFVDFTSDDQGLRFPRAFPPPKPEKEKERPKPYKGLPIGFEVAKVDVDVPLVRIANQDGQAGLEIWGVTLDSAVDLVKNEPLIDTTGLAFRAEFIKPLEGPFQVIGDADFHGDHVTAADLQVELLGSQLVLDGIWQLVGQGTDMDLTLERLDVDALSPMMGDALAGVYTGALHLDGNLRGLGLVGTLDGEENGTVTFQEGSAVCIGGDGERCGSTVLPTDQTGPGAVRWKVDLLTDQFAVEKLIPPVVGPLVLDGHIQARGGGTSYPDGIVVEDGRIDGQGLDVFGLPFRDAHGSFELHRGLVRGTDLDVTAIGGTARGAATLDLVGGALGGDFRGVVDLSMLADLGVEDLYGRGPFRARVDGNVLEDGTPIHVAGQVQVRQGGVGRDITADVVEGPFDVDYRDGHVKVVGDWQATGAAAYGAEAEQLSVPGLVVDVGEAVDIQGSGFTPVLTYGGFIVMDAVEAPFHFRTEGGHLSLDATATLADHDLSGLQGDQGALSFTLRDDDADVELALQRDDYTWVAVKGGHLDLATTTISADLLRLQLDAEKVIESTSPVSFRVAEAGIADADIHLALPEGSLDVTGDLGGEGPLDGTVVLSDVGLAGLSPLYPEDLANLTGTVDLDLTARGTAASPDLEGDLTLAGVTLDETLAGLDAEMAFGWRDDQAVVDLAAGREGQRRILLHGELPVEGGLLSPTVEPTAPLLAELTLEGLDLERLARLLPSTPLPTGVLTGHMVVTGPLVEPDMTLDLGGDVRLFGIPEVVTLDIEGALTGTDFTLRGDLHDEEDVHFADLDARAQVELRKVLGPALGADPDDPDLMVGDWVRTPELDLVLSDLQVEPVVHRFLPYLEMAGLLDANVAVRGEVMRPDVVVQMGFDGEIEREPVKMALTADQTGKLGMDVGDGTESWLTVDGMVPLDIDLTRETADWVTGPMDVRFGGQGMPLKVLTAPFPSVYADAGRLSLSGALEGELGSIVPSVELAVEDGDFIVEDLGLRFLDTHGTGRVVPTADGLRLEAQGWEARTRPVASYVRAQERSARSLLRMDASLDVSQEGLGAVSANIEMDDAWLIATDAYQIQTAGSVSVQGELPKLEATGDLSLTQGEVKLNLAELTGATGLVLDDDLVVHRTVDSALAAERLAEKQAEEEQPTLVEELDAKITLNLNRSLQAQVILPLLSGLGEFGAAVSQIDLSTRMDGELEVTIDEGEVKGVGSLETIGGELKVLNARFGVDTSTIRFFGDITDPELDVNASMEGDGIDIKLTGTAMDPQLALSSADGASDAQLFAVLFTGRSPDELNADQGQAAAQAVGDLLLGGLLASVNLGNVSIDTDGSVQVGVPVTRNVYFEGILSPAAGPQDNTFQAIIDWSIIPKFVLSAGFGNQVSFAELVYEYSFWGRHYLPPGHLPDRPRYNRVEKQLEKEEEARRAAEAEARDAVETRDEEARRRRRRDKEKEREEERQEDETETLEEIREDILESPDPEDDDSSRAPTQDDEGPAPG